MTWQWVGLLGLSGGLALVGLGIGMVWIGGKRTVSGEQRAEAIRLKKEMEALLATPGWKKLVEYAEKQTVERSNSVLLSPTEEPLKQEYMKGEIQGIKLFTRLPEIVISTSKDIIEAYNRESGEVDEG